VFLAECYAPGLTTDRFNRDSNAIRQAAAAMTAAGRFVQCQYSVHVPSDDLALYIIDTTSATHIQQLGDNAAVTFDRILACLTALNPDDPTHTENAVLNT